MRALARSAARSARWVAALPALLAAGCGAPQPAADDYFPLEAGLSWTYRQTTALDDHERQVERLTIHSRGPENLGGETTTRRHTDSGLDYWVRRDRSGVFRVAHKTPLDRYPQADEPHRYVLAAPYQVGSSWQTLTTAYALQRRSEVPKEVRRFHKPVPMTYTIADAAASVEVPAGRFERCLRVHGHAAVRVYVDAQFAWREIGLSAREWYCPGVGLVKVEREELSPSRFMVGGRVTLELERFN